MAADIPPAGALTPLWPGADEEIADAAGSPRTASNPLAVDQARYRGVEWIEHPHPHWLHHLDVIGCPRALEQNGLCQGCIRNGFTAGTTYKVSPWLSQIARAHVRIQRLICVEGGEQRELHGSIR